MSRKNTAIELINRIEQANAAYLRFIFQKITRFLTSFVNYKFNLLLTKMSCNTAIELVNRIEETLNRNIIICHAALNVAKIDSAWEITCQDQTLWHTVENGAGRDVAFDATLTTNYGV